MLTDIIIDTNIFVHADTLKNSNRDSAIRFLSTLKGKKTQLCVDEHYDFDDSSKNESFIVNEYLNHIGHGSFSFGILLYLLSKNRIIPKSRNVPPGVSKKIVNIIHDKKDRVFGKVAHNSINKTIITHNSPHFPRDKLRTLSITVLDAQSCISVLN